MTSGSVIALAGRLVDRPDAAQVHFPASNVRRVRDGIQALMAQAEARVLVASAAAGADLLAHEVAASLGLRRIVVLPFRVARFRETSVLSRPGSWDELFRRLVLTPHERLSVIGDEEDEREGAFDEANGRIVRAARSIAEQEALDPVATLVWDGPHVGARDYTERFRRLAEESGFPLREILTLDPG